jgi:lambda repressor-like predicted transcriptional regulator
MLGSENKEPSLKVIWAELEIGVSLTRITQEHQISRSTLADKLRRENRNRYMSIMSSQSRNLEKNVDLPKVWTELERGTSLARIAGEHQMSHPTLREKLRRNDEERYVGIMRLMDSRDPAVRRSRALSKVSADMLKEFEQGSSLGELSRKYGVYKRTLQRRFMNIYGDRYREFFTTRRVGFGSRTGLGDSEFETEIMKLLKENSVRFSFHEKLRVEGHAYIPDFLIGENTIVEVTGMTTRRYWDHTSEKLRTYIRNGYRVILVIQRRKLKSVQQYFPSPSRSFAVLEHEKLRANFQRYLEIVVQTV